MDLIPGEIYRTPWDPAGTVRVVQIERPHPMNGKPTVFVQFVGDHPRGMKDGEFGRYFADELRPAEAVHP